MAATVFGESLYVANFDDDTVSVIRTSDNTVINTVEVGNEPMGVAARFVNDEQLVYVTNSGDDTVSVIRTSDNTVVDTVDVGNGPEGIAVSGDFVYVTNAGRQHRVGNPNIRQHGGGYGRCGQWPDWRHVRGRFHIRGQF